MVTPKICDFSRLVGNDLCVVPLTRKKQFPCENLKFVIFQGSEAKAYVDMSSFDNTEKNNFYLYVS